MTQVYHRRPEAAREKFAKIFYFYLGYFPRVANRKLRWTAEPLAVTLRRRAEHQAEVRRLTAELRTCSGKEYPGLRAKLSWHQARVIETYSTPVNPFMEA